MGSCPCPGRCSPLTRKAGGQTSSAISSSRFAFFSRRDRPIVGRGTFRQNVQLGRTSTTLAGTAAIRRRGKDGPTGSTVQRAATAAHDAPPLLVLQGLGALVFGPLLPVDGPPHGEGVLPQKANRLGRGGMTQIQRLLQVVGHRVGVAAGLEEGQGQVVMGLGGGGAVVQVEGIVVLDDGSLGVSENL